MQRTNRIFLLSSPQVPGTHTQEEVWQQSIATPSISQQAACMSSALHTCVNVTLPEPASSAVGNSNR